MVNFNLRNAAIYKALVLEKNLLFGFAKLLKNIFFILFLLSFSLFVYGFLPSNFGKQTLSQLLGLTTIFLVLDAEFWLGEKFFNSKLKKPKLAVSLKEAFLNPEKYNLAEFLSFESAKALSKAFKLAKSKGLDEPNSSLVLYFALLDNPKLDFVFFRLLLDRKNVQKLLNEEQKPIDGSASDFKEVISESLKIAAALSKERIELSDLLISLARNNLLFKKILIDNNIREENFEDIVWWLDYLGSKLEDKKKWWQYHNLIKRGSLAKEWMSGYTITLDGFSLDWSEVLKRRGFPEVVGHKSELEQMERILSRTETNNILLVGESGTGRKSIVEALASKSFLGQSSREVNYKRFVELRVSDVVSRAGDSQEIENVLDKILEEAVLAGNVILIIDEFHNFVGAKERPGTIDISGIVSPYLQLPNFQIIAITTFAGLHKNIEQNPSVLALFEKVEVSEVSPKESLELLELRVPYLESKNKIFFSYQALEEIINYCEKFLPAFPFPEKALDVLDEVAVYVSSLKEKVVLSKHVAKIISEKSQIPVGEMEAKEREILLNLEKLIHERIINQEEAVGEVSSALRRARAEVQVRKGPMGTFLFLGPTGVGKTETSKALAEIYFGSEEKMIRLDMSEFQDVKDIPRLIGSAGEEGILTTQVRENPFSIILLDEIEKAHPNILNLFLQVLDEGHLTDGLGRKVDFKSAIIIATSNAGYKIILQALKDKSDFSKIKDKLLDELFSEGVFRPEFINRFDAVVVFKPLTKENLLDIAQLLLSKLKKNLFKKGIDFIVTPALKEKIVDLGYDPTFGARQMRRVIQDKVENVLAQALLSGELKRGGRAEVDPTDFSLKKQ